MVVRSLAVAPAEPPPETLTTFIAVAGAFVATLTVTVMIG
jgi:hypothetical protein